MASGLLVAAASAGLVLRRRRAARTRERVDLYFADGATVSLEGSDAGDLIPLAQRVLAATS